MDNEGTGCCGEGTRVGSQAAFRETQLSGGWKMKRLLPGRKGGRVLPAEEMQRQRHGDA